MPYCLAHSTPKYKYYSGYLLSNGMNLYSMVLTRVCLSYILSLTLHRKNEYLKDVYSFINLDRLGFVYPERLNSQPFDP